MKKFACLMIAVLLPAFVLAQTAGPRTVSFTDRVTGGSASFTNSPLASLDAARSIGGIDNAMTSGSAAYELKRIEFVVSDTPFTNTFTMSLDRKYKLPDTIESHVTTSQVINPATGSGWVETNYYHHTAGVAWFTNTYTFASTTNVVTPQIFDLDDFGRGLMWEPYDVMSFTWTSTNAIDLIRVFDLYPRP